MKRLMKLICLVSMFTVLMAPAVFGYSIQIYQNSYSYSNGGEFTIVSNDLAGVAGAYTGYTQGVRPGGTFNFETFCLEYNEHFSPGGTYYAQISPGMAAVKGGTANYDVISQGTAWLYQQFITGQLTNYDYVNAAARKNSAGLLQQAIWFLEDEGQGNINNYYVQLARNHFSDDNSLTVTKGDYAGTGVSVLNVWANSNYTGYAQDQLIGIPVPEPTTMLLLGLGLLGLGLSSRKFKK